MEKFFKSLTLDMKHFYILFLFLLFGLPSVAQKSYFEYESTGIISCLSDDGMYATDITIPADVTLVREGAFDNARRVESLTIADGGNPAFEADALSGASSTLETLYLGNAMTVANMRSLFVALGEGNSLVSVEIENYDTSDQIQWDHSPMTEILTSGVTFTLPAALVDDQIFGNAQVKGHFSIPDGISLSTFCATQIFSDFDDGSNLLFYIPVRIQDGQLFIKRVHYILPNQGFLMHFAEGSAANRDVYLLRESIDDLANVTEYNKDYALYQDNMLVGVPEKTGRVIGKTEGDYTNLVLYNGAFHRTSGGTLGANRAYLQVLTTVLDAILSSGPLPVKKIDDTTAIQTIESSETSSEPWYTLSGIQLNGEPQAPGIYLKDGKKVRK